MTTQNYFPLDSQTFDFPSVTVIDRALSETFHDAELWEKARLQVQMISRLPADWDGDGAARIPISLASSALRLLGELRAQGYPAPNDVYPLAEGTIVLEWQLANDVIYRIEVDRVGQGECMISFPTEPSQFSRITWSMVSPGTWGAPVRKLALSHGGGCSLLSVDLTRCSEHNLRSTRSPCDRFQIAA